MGAPSVHFFISYTASDVAWARWLDFALREAGYETITQEYDFRAGNNFVHEMQAALERAERVLAVLTPAYVRSGFAGAEWAAAFASDPTGKDSKLLPVRVVDFEPTGLFRGIVHIDLVGKDEAEGRADLLSRLKQGTRPAAAPKFPGKARDDANAPTFPGELPPIWNIPRPRNPYFTGRDGVLNKLHEALGAGKTAALAQAVKGLGGVGKTGLALEYAYRFATEYRGIWWLRAEDPVALLADYAALAEPLGVEASRDLPETARAVRRALDERERFLLIFDNAEEPKHLEAFLPRGSGVRVLVTTRALAWPGAAASHIDTLADAEAVEFLERRTERSNEPGALRIAQLVGGLPLALEQAAAYVIACEKSFSDYAHLLEKHGLRVLESGAPHDYPSTVGTTWDLALKALDGSRGAAELLRLAAFFAPEPIHLGDLGEAARKLRDQGEKERLPEPLESVLSDEVLLDAARAALFRYSLVSGDTETISVHRLVQQVTREKLDDRERNTWLGAALRSVSAAFPYDSDDVRTWPTCARWLEHARGLVDRPGAADLEPGATGTLLNQAGLYLDAQAAYAQAESLYRRALAMGEASLGPEHPNVATRLNNLAGLLQATNRLIEAEPLLRRALAIVEAVLGANHPTVATGLSNLALLLQDTNRLTEAEPHYRRALAIDEAALGPNHPSVARDLNNLALLLQGTNRLTEAEPHYRRVLAIYEASLGPNHPNIATGLNNLALLLQDTNRLTEAEPHYRRALAIDEASLGPNHPSVAIRLNNLAGLLKDTSRQMEAESLLRRALAIDEASLGPNHPNVAIRLNNLATLLRDTNRLAEAEPLYRRALGIFESSVGPEHPRTMKVRENLARLLGPPK